MEQQVVLLTPKQAGYLERLVSSGDYRSVNEAVGAVLDQHREDADALVDWLRREAVPVYDRLKGDPASRIPAEQVFARLRARHAERFGTKGAA